MNPAGRAGGDATAAVIVERMRSRLPSLPGLKSASSSSAAAFFTSNGVLARVAGVVVDHRRRHRARGGLAVTEKHHFEQRVAIDRMGERLAHALSAK